MKRITFYLDFISPYACLAFEHLPVALQGCSYEVEYRPVLFAAMLKANGQLGPAEIPGKREWTYRQVAWIGRTNGIPFDMPATHPFNPLPLLRLALACGKGGAVNRYVAETIFRHVWRGGADATEPKRFEALKAQLATARDANADDVKAELKSNTDAALARGVFGVPTYAVDDQVFWGFDALPVLRAYLGGDTWFESPAWTGVGGIPSAAGRVNKPAA
jgi:2-hydroxychromene-2-carboxylate isomerase